MAIRKEFLGRGFAFPFHFDPAGGGVALSEYEENIRQNISIILGTQPGERQMLPDFGCRIHELLFAPDNSYAGQLAARHVEDALRRWEPRIEVIGVEAVPDPTGAIRVEVAYRITSTGVTERLEQVVASSAR
jgi:phage baseplate assembly protein W